MTGPEKKAAEMLVDETGKRSQVRFPETGQVPASGPAVVLGTRDEILKAYPDLAAKLGTGSADGKAEGYHIVTMEPGLVIVAGNDERGVLFGAGRLLRLMDYTGEVAPDHLGTVKVDAGINLSTSPAYPLRGHQLGDRETNNAYDGWTVAMYEQYYRDLVIYGTNAIEGIPPAPHSDDRLDSPHYTLPPEQMMGEQSRLAKEYGIEFWIWYALTANQDYRQPEAIAKALSDFEHETANLPRLDAVFIPGGDPGHTEPKVLFPLLEKFAAILKKHHPNAKLWMSPQGFSTLWMKDFYDIMDAKPSWLEGIAFGPHGQHIDELRARVPKQFKLRLYPDITHSLASQYLARDWDFAYGATENRECFNPRPVDYTAVFKCMMPYCEVGFLSYTEGVNDDVNKILWSSLGWDPDQKPVDIMRDYSHYFIGGGALGESFAQGLMALERNWWGPLASNEGVYTTLAQFQDMERTASPAVLENWRFQQALFRAYYDATDRARLIAETAQEGRADDDLERARVIGSQAAIAAAERDLEVSDPPVAQAWRARCFELAEALFQSIRAQLSVPRYKAQNVRRGAYLDLIDYPLNDAPWMREQFAAVRALPTEAERLRKIDEMLHWTDPGPGGFYDNLGDVRQRPHLVLGLGYDKDPAYERSPAIGFGPRTRPPYARVSSSRFAETLHDQHLFMAYHDLDRTAHYKVKIMYGSETAAQVELKADGKYVIEPMEPKFPYAERGGGASLFGERRPLDIRPIPRVFDIPAEATADGNLTLEWSKPPNDDDTGRGVQVAEVWLMREP
jgi:hypothetical protein